MAAERAGMAGCYRVETVDSGESGLLALLAQAPGGERLTGAAPADPAASLCTSRAMSLAYAGDVASLCP